MLLLVVGVVVVPLCCLLQSSSLKTLGMSLFLGCLTLTCLLFGEDIENCMGFMTNSRTTHTPPWLGCTPVQRLLGVDQNLRFLPFF